MVTFHLKPPFKSIVWSKKVNTIAGHKFDHLAINSTTRVAAEAGVTPVLPATAVVEFMAKWLYLYLRTVLKR